jgi:hypothetical protein
MNESEGMRQIASEYLGENFETDMRGVYLRGLGEQGISEDELQGFVQSVIDACCMVATAQAMIKGNIVVAPSDNRGEVLIQIVTNTKEAQRNRYWIEKWRRQTAQKK